MTVKLLTEQYFKFNLEFLSLTGGRSQDRLNLFMSECHIVGNQVAAHAI